MRIKIDGKDIDKGSRVTIETSEYSDDQAWTIVIAGAAAILWILKDWRWW